MKYIPNGCLFNTESTPKPMFELSMELSLKKNTVRFESKEEKKTSTELFQSFDHLFRPYVLCDLLTLGPK